MTGGRCPYCFVGELGPVMPVNRDVPNLGPRISILDRTGKRVARFGGSADFMAPHGLAVDSHGDLYVGEVSWTQWPQIHPDEPRPAGLRSLQKFRRVGAGG
jgi:hypothetical protein